MIELGINTIFELSDIYCATLFERLNKIKINEITFDNIMEKIYEIFIMELDNFIIPKDFERLKYLSVIKHYQKFLKYSKNSSLKQNIFFLLKYFKTLISNNNSILYFGNSFGEIQAFGGASKVYVDLKTKTNKELINLAIIKLKMENDFVSHKLGLFFDFLFDCKKISQDEYNKIRFGTNDETKLKLIKLGLTLNIINILKKDNQLKNISWDKNNNIVYNEEIKKYKNNLDDFMQFELDKIF